MSENLIQIKTFLGKYYSELNYAALQEKYATSGLDNIFEQRFYIQNNKSQMIVDGGLEGLAVVFAGNEVHISKALYDHPSVLITNSLENKNQNSNPKSLYNPETFSTVAYLICQNHTMFQIVGEVDEPIYVKYKSDYETFYSSVTIFEISAAIDVEIVEEIESHSALNAVTNYILHPAAGVNLTTFYQNNISASSIVYRNIIMQEATKFNHVLMGKGSSSAIDEIRVHPHHNSKSEFLGLVNANNRRFHSILCVQPSAEEYSLNVDYKDIVYGNGRINFHPVILGDNSTGKSTINVSSIDLDAIPIEQISSELSNYAKDIMDRATLTRMIGVKRFYNNKAKFIQIQ